MLTVLNSSFLLATRILRLAPLLVELTSAVWMPANHISLYSCFFFLSSPTCCRSSRFHWQHHTVLCPDQNLGVRSQTMQAPPPSLLYLSKLKSSHAYTTTTPSWLGSQQTLIQPPQLIQKAVTCLTLNHAKYFHLSLSPGSSYWIQHLSSLPSAFPEVRWPPQPWQDTVAPYLQGWTKNSVQPNMSCPPFSLSSACRPTCIWSPYSSC